MNFKLFAATLTVVLAGCSTSGNAPSGQQSAGTPAAGAPAAGTPAAGSPVAGSPATANGRCDASAIESVVGERFSERAAQNAQSRAGAATLRVLQPGQVMTMEYNPQRLTIIVDDSGNIGSARCG